MGTDKRGFTLMEIMIVIIILGVIVAFAIPSYTKAVEKGYERDAVVQLQAIASAAEFYKGQAGDYPDGSTMTNVSQINSVLGLNIVQKEMTYACSAGVMSGFDCSATSDLYGWAVHVSSDPLNLTPHCAASPACPTCTTTSCPY